MIDVIICAQVSFLDRDVVPMYSRASVPALLIGMVIGMNTHSAVRVIGIHVEAGEPDIVVFTEPAGDGSPLFAEDLDHKRWHRSRVDVMWPQR